MKIVFTKHTEFKFKILKRHKFLVTRDQIEDIIKRPEKVKKGKSNRLIAQKSISKTHLIRVIYERNDEIRDITFYPARRWRYEGQI